MKLPRLHLGVHALGVDLLKAYTAHGVRAVVAMQLEPGVLVFVVNSMAGRRRRYITRMEINDWRRVTVSVRR